MKQLVKDGLCQDCLCFPWMSHQLHNSQRKRLGTIGMAHSMAHTVWPIPNQILYGNRNQVKNISLRFQFHVFFLKYIHPFTREPVVIYFTSTNLYPIYSIIIYSVYKLGTLNHHYLDGRLKQNLNQTPAKFTNSRNLIRISSSFRTLKWSFSVMRHHLWP